MQNLALDHSLGQCMLELLHYSNRCSPRHFDKMTVADSAEVEGIVATSVDIVGSDFVGNMVAGFECSTAGFEAVEQPEADLVDSIVVVVAFRLGSVDLVDCTSFPLGTGVVGRSRH